MKPAANGSRSKAKTIWISLILIGLLAGGRLWLSLLEPKNRRTGPGDRPKRILDQAGAHRAALPWPPPVRSRW